jgi:hypothetical protein
VGSRSKARARAQASQAAAQRESAPRPQAAQTAQRSPQAAQIRPRGVQTRGQAVTAPAAAPAGQPPRTVLALAVIEAVEAAGVLLAAALAGIDTGSGKAYELASGIAITAIAVGTALALGFVARGLRAGRRWTRTPALLTQLFTAVAGIILTQGGRYDWGIPALVLAAAGFAMLMAPPSVQLLTPGRPQEPGQQ